MEGAILELPQTWNKYSYEYNRPLYGTDPDGRCPPCIGAIVGGVVEGGFDLGKQFINNGYSFKGTNWQEVGANALGGAVAGGLAVATGGASLVESAIVGDVAAGATSSMIGGVVTRAAEGDSADDVMSAGDISEDALSGFVGGGAGHIAADMVHVPEEPMRPDARHRARTSVYMARRAARNRALVSQAVRSGVVSSAASHGTNGAMGMINSIWNWLMFPSSNQDNSSVTVTQTFSLDCKQNPGACK